MPRQELFCLTCGAAALHSCVLKGHQTETLQNGPPPIEDERITAENFVPLFTRVLRELNQEPEAKRPIKEYKAVAAYMLGLAGCFGFVLIDNRVKDGSGPWVRLTLLGEKWLENPTSLELLEIHKPQVLE